MPFSPTAETAMTGRAVPQRSGTRKGGPKKDYSAIQQGVVQLYPRENTNINPNVEYVLAIVYFYLG